MTEMTNRCSFVLSAIIFTFLSMGYVSSAASAGDAAAEWMQSSLAHLAGESSQVLLVEGKAHEFHAKLYALEKRVGKWCNAFPPMQALIGKNGFAPPGGKKEGDVKTPSGVFTLKRTFGYEPRINSRMPYRQVGEDDIWVDDVASPEYNRWLRKGETSAASFEGMKLNDDLYRYGIVIEYNTDPVVRGAGSAIFIHVRRGKNMPTLGCVALPAGDILKVLAWLNPACKPLTVMGTRDSITLLVRKAHHKQEGAAQALQDKPSPRQGSAGRLPKGFVYADEMIPGLRLDLRYAGTHNFVGERVDGYLKQRCILSGEAAEALKKVQEELRRFGLGLKIFDAYRPQMAVDHFVRWARNGKDIRMKPEFYPDVAKKDLFEDGYIAAKSGHSRGSTVDVTIVSLKGGEEERELDMGSGFDFFGLRSWSDYPDIPSPCRANRLLLRMLMGKHGFKPYPAEWWHFTLKKEPWPDTYFNFPVQ